MTESDLAGAYLENKARFSASLDNLKRTLWYFFFFGKCVIICIEYAGNVFPDRNNRLKVK